MCIFDRTFLKTFFLLFFKVCALYLYEKGKVRTLLVENCMNYFPTQKNKQNGACCYICQCQLTDLNQKIY